MAAPTTSTTTTSPTQAAADAAATLRPHCDDSAAINACVETLERIAAGTEPADDGEDQLTKAMIRITNTRSEVRKNADASPALVETAEKAHATVAQEYLAQHSGAYSVWEEAARKAGRLPEQSAA
jgi:hypothetical protein